MMSMLSHLELQVSSARICQMELSRFKNELVSNPSKFILHFKSDTFEIKKKIFEFLPGYILFIDIKNLLTNQKPEFSIIIIIY